jgi:hypothetical protein
MSNFQVPRWQLKCGVVPRPPVVPWCNKPGVNSSELELHVVCQLQFSGTEA